MWNLMNTIEEHTDRLHAFIRSRVSVEEDSWDVLQDVFTALTARWNLGEALEDGAAWLFRVARNRIIDLYRRKRYREQSLDELLLAEDGGMAELEDIQAVAPDEEHRRSARKQRMLEVLRELPAEQREVFLRTEMDGISFAELSEETGVPVNTLLSRKRYAVLRLRKVMDEFQIGKAD